MFATLLSNPSSTPGVFPVYAMTWMVTGILWVSPVRFAKLLSFRMFLAALSAEFQIASPQW